MKTFLIVVCTLLVAIGASVAADKAVEVDPLHISGEYCSSGSPPCVSDNIRIAYLGGNNSGRAQYGVKAIVYNSAGHFCDATFVGWDDLEDKQTVHIDAPNDQCTLQMHFTEQTIELRGTDECTHVCGNAVSFNRHSFARNPHRLR